MIFYSTDTKITVKLLFLNAYSQFLYLTSHGLMTGDHAHDLLHLTLRDLVVGNFIKLARF